MHFVLPSQFLSIENNKKVYCHSYQKYIITVFLLTSVLHVFIQEISSLQSLRNCRFPEYSALIILCFTFPVLAKEIPLIPVMTWCFSFSRFPPHLPIRCLYFKSYLLHIFSYKLKQSTNYLRVCLSESCWHSFLQDSPHKASFYLKKSLVSFTCAKWNSIGLSILFYCYCTFSLDPPISHVLYFHKAWSAIKHLVHFSRKLISL